MTRHRFAPLAVLLILSVTIAGCDWTQAGFNGSNAGSQTFNTAFSPETIGSLHAEWTATIPNSTASKLAVAGDTIFASSQVPGRFMSVGNTIPGAGDDPTTTTSTTTTLPTGPPPAPPFEALNAADGTVRWTAGSEVVTDTGDQGQCITDSSAQSPLVLAGVVYGMTTSSTCAQSPMSAFGSTSTLDSSTGAVVSTDPDHLLIGDPVGDRRAVYTTRMSNPVGSSPRTFDVTGSDGFEFSSPRGYALGGAAIDSNSLFVMDDMGRLYAVDRTTGAVKWTGADQDIDRSYTPSVGDGMVFLSTSGRLLAFDIAGIRGCTTTAGATSCAPVWNDSLYSPNGPQFATMAPPTISNHRLFVRQDYMLKVFSTDTGQLLWQARTSPDIMDDQSPFSAPPSVAGAIVFIGTADGSLQAYDVTGTHGCTQVSGVTTCTPLWSASLGGDASWARPVIAGNSVYVSSGVEAQGPVIQPATSGNGSVSDPGTSMVTKFSLSSAD